ncbi:MAG: TonB-dependent receptor [Ignavibacteria bacterium]|nr:TonB-dependent receptor [Ignavibacteria bacterium]
MRHIKFFRRFVLVIVIQILASLGPAIGQNQPWGAISGAVLTADTRQGLPLATVLIAGTTIGTVTNEKGEFALTSLNPGDYTIHVRLMGYEDAWLEGIRVRRGKTIKVNIAMVEAAIPLEEVQVTADRMKPQDDIRSSVLAVTPFRAKTLAGVGEDVLRTLEALPGVLSPNDFTSQLVIRGSGPDQNLIVMDDIEIFNPYRLYGIISMFNPETASDISLITGGFPVKYGDRLSAVIDVTNREGDKSTPMGGSLNASITNANLVLNGRSPVGLDGSYVVSARRTYYDLILGPIAKNSGLVKGDVAFPHFTDVQGKIVLEPGHGHKFIANGISSRDGVELVAGPDRDAPDSLTVLDDTRNDVLGFAWHYVPSRKFFSKLGFSWYRNSGITEFGGDFIDPSLNRELFENGGDTTGIRFFNVEFDSRYVFRKYSLKEQMTWIARGQTIEIGAGVDFMKTSLIWHFRPDETLQSLLQSRNTAVVRDFVQTKVYERLNLFAQDKIKLTEQLAVQPGLRLDHFGILGKTYIQPRLNVSYALSPITTLRAAVGLYYQSPGYEKLLDQDKFFDLTNAAVGDLEAEKATHYILGVDRWIDNQWLFRVETYYKKFDDVIVQEYVPGTLYESYPIPGGDIRTPSGWTQPVAVKGDSLTNNPINAGTGRSYGIEILLEKKNIGPDSRISGWITYALAKGERVRDNIITPFRFDQRHTVNVVVDYRITSWLDVGIRWRYGTNFPYTEPVGIKPRIATVTKNGREERVIETDINGDVIFNTDRGGEENRFSHRLPAYHRLDLRLTAQADYWGLDWNFYIDVINVYNRNNILVYRFHIEDDLTIGRNEVSMLPLLPTLGFSVRF